MGADHNGSCNGLVVLVGGSAPFIGPFNGKRKLDFLEQRMGEYCNGAYIREAHFCSSPREIGEDIVEAVTESAIDKSFDKLFELFLEHFSRVISLHSFYPFAMVSENLPKGEFRGFGDFTEDQMSRLKSLFGGGFVGSVRKGMIPYQTGKNTLSNMVKLAVYGGKIGDRSLGIYVGRPAEYANPRFGIGDTKPADPPIPIYPLRRLSS